MEDERPDIKIENAIAIWDINSVGSIMGSYHGTFRFRCVLSPLQQIACGREERELLGPNLALANDHERFLAYALTQLKFRIVSAPPFWSASTYGSIQGDLVDEEIITLILSAAIDGEKKYKDQIRERKEAAIKRAKDAADAITKAQLSEREENEALEKA